MELEAPEIFALLVGAFAALIASAAVELWLGVARVRIEEGRVEVRRSWLGLGWTRSIPAADVTGLGLRIGMQHGRSAGTPYYDLVIHRAAGRPLLAARHVRSKRDAEWLASEMKLAIGLRDPVSSPADRTPATPGTPHPVSTE